MSEAAWDKAFTQGSTALKNRLMKVHANNPKFQTWLKSSGHGAGASVKQASKEVKPSERVKKLQVKSLQAYGATKGLKVGGEHGSGEMKDTIAPLTRDQHSKVQAAARAAKAAEKPAAAKKTPLTKSQRMAAIAAAVRKAQTKHDVPTMDPDDESHDDLRDLHQSLHIRKGYNEEVALDEVTKQEAEKALGGPVKTRTGNEPKGKLPLGFRAARNLARKAMKTGAPVPESYEYTNIGHPPEHSIDDDPQPSTDPLKLTTTRKKPVQFKSGMRNGVKTLKKESTEESQMKKGRMLALAVMKKNQLKHPIAQQMGEEIKDEADVGEYDYEGDMAKSQLRSILAHAKRLHDMLEDQTNLPEWVQSKITLAQDYILTAADYMEGEMNEEVEQIDEISRGRVVDALHAAERKKWVASAMDDATPKGDNRFIHQADDLGGQVGRVASNILKRDRRVKARAAGKNRKGPGWSPEKPKTLGDRVRGLLGPKPPRGLPTMEEVEQIDEASYSAKAARAGKDIGKPGKMFAKIAAGAAKRYGSEESGKRVAGAVLKKLRAEEVEQIDEGDLSIRTLYNKWADHYTSSEGNSAKRADAVEKTITKVHGPTVMKHLQKAVNANLRGDFDGEERHFEKARTAAEKSGSDRVGATVGKDRSKFRKEEVEQVTEAEGTLAVTPKQKELAAHHGDKTRITYGDVLKARLKSAAEKAMKKGN